MKIMEAMSHLSLSLLSRSSHLVAVCGFPCPFPLARASSSKSLNGQEHTKTETFCLSTLYGFSITMNCAMSLAIS